MACALCLGSVAACGDDDDATGASADDAAAPAQDDGGGSGEDGGTAGELRLGQAGWEGGCTVISEDEVEAATGFAVTGSEETTGCDWSVEQVDPDVLADHSIGWQPQQSGTFETQRASIVEADSSIVIEPIEGLGNDAFWQGTEESPLGEVWVSLDQLDFRIVNQFASGGYDGEIREPMEALAGAIADALAGTDVPGT